MGILFYENCSIFVIEIIYLYLHFKKVSAEEGVHGLMNHPLSVFIRFVTWPFLLKRFALGISVFRRKFRNCTKANYFLCPEREPYMDEGSFSFGRFDFVISLKLAGTFFDAS